MSSSFPTPWNNDSESSYDDEIIYGCYSEIAESSYSGYYAQPRPYLRPSLGTFDTGSTDPVSWAQIDPSSSLASDSNSNLGFDTPILPHLAH
jgi:hypothetical protein